eukprot:SAG31_NODE_13493_length_865_cov_1.558747_1_plen_138_part_01
MGRQIRKQRLANLMGRQVRRKLGSRVATVLCASVLLSCWHDRCSVVAQEAFEDSSLAKPCSHIPGTAWDGSCSIEGDWNLLAHAVRYTPLGCARMPQSQQLVQFKRYPQAISGSLSRLLPEQECLWKCSSQPDLSMNL